MNLVLFVVILGVVLLTNISINNHVEASTTSSLDNTKKESIDKSVSLKKTNEKQSKDKKPKTQIFSNYEFEKIKDQYDKHLGVWVKLKGRIADLESNTKGNWIILDYNVGKFDYFTYDKLALFHTVKSNSKINQHDCMLAEGKLEGSINVTPEIAFESIIIPKIELQKWQKIECMNVLFPSYKTVMVNKAKIIDGVEVSIEKIEFTPWHTRMYVSVENKANPHNLSISSFVRITQDGVEYLDDPSSVGLMDYDRIESELPLGVKERGVILFESIKPKSLDVQISIHDEITYEDTPFRFNLKIQ